MATATYEIRYRYAGGTRIAREGADTLEDARTRARAVNGVVVDYAGSIVANFTGPDKPATIDAGAVPVTFSRLPVGATFMTAPPVAWSESRTLIKTGPKTVTSPDSTALSSICAFDMAAIVYVTRAFAVTMNPVIALSWEHLHIDCALCTCTIDDRLDTIYRVVNNSGPSEASCYTVSRYVVADNTTTLLASQLPTKEAAHATVTNDIHARAGTIRLRYLSQYNHRAVLCISEGERIHRFCAESNGSPNGSDWYIFHETMLPFTADYHAIGRIQQGITRDDAIAFLTMCNPEPYCRNSGMTEQEGAR